MDVLDSPITEEEIMRAVEHLKPNKAPGTDGILAEMIKTSLPQILPFLVALFNRIFDTGSTRLHGQVQLLFRYIKVATRTTLIIIGGCHY